MPSVKTPSIFATLLYSGNGKGNVVVTNLGPNVVSVRTGSGSSGNIYTSLGVGKTLTGVPAYLCHVKDANGNDISITPPHCHNGKRIEHKRIVLHNRVHDILLTKRRVA